MLCHYWHYALRKRSIHRYQFNSNHRSQILVKNGIHWLKNYFWYLLCSLRLIFNFLIVCLTCRNNALRARKLVLVESSTSTNKVQGIVSSLKDSFGFIERADKVAEIFFHYSEFQGEIGELMIGDDVEFALQDRKVSQEIFESIVCY